MAAACWAFAGASDLACDASCCAWASTCCCCDSCACSCVSVRRSACSSVQVAHDLLGVLDAGLVQRRRGVEVRRHSRLGSAVHVGGDGVVRHQPLVHLDGVRVCCKFASIDCSALWALCRLTAVLYRSSSTAVCCSSCTSVLSICVTCDREVLICDWFGAGPGSVVGVAPAPAPGMQSSATNSPGAMAAPGTLGPPRTVDRPFTAPTGHSVTVHRRRTGTTAFGRVRRVRVQFTFVTIGGRARCAQPIDRAPCRS